MNIICSFSCRFKPCSRHLNAAVAFGTSSWRRDSVYGVRRRFQYETVSGGKNIFPAIHLHTNCNCMTSGRSHLPNTQVAWPCAIPLSYYYCPVNNVIQLTYPKRHLRIYHSMTTQWTLPILIYATVQKAWAVITAVDYYFNLIHSKLFYLCLLKTIPMPFLIFKISVLICKLHSLFINILYICTFIRTPGHKKDTQRDIALLSLPF